MMRRTGKYILLACMLLTLSAALVTACTQQQAHEHTFAQDWSSDATHHWHEATCGHDVVGDKGEHVFEENVCSVCGYTRQSPDLPIEDDESYEIATLTYGHVRIQLLSDTLVRIEECNEDGNFEDRASYIVVNRDDWGPTVEYETNETEAAFCVETQNYTVVVPKGSNADGIRIEDPAGNVLYEYHGLTDTNIYLPSPSDELASWYFTDSPRVIPSEYGYSVTEEPLPVQGWDFESDATDIFVFLPKGNYRTFSEDFVSLTGQSEMVSLKMFGYWDSRYYAYNEETALQQIKDYQDRGYAIDILVVDTDWRDSSNGWGYDINTELFPDMEGFLEKAHSMGVNICFNDHPQPVDGTDNLLDGDEVAYRNEKLTMLLAMGVDYWWYDRNWAVSLNPIDEDHTLYSTGMYAYQWITQSYLESITDVGEYAKRALIMANVDGCDNGSFVYASDLSAHRYSVQWTGDTNSQEDDLQQEIEGAVFAGAELGLPYVGTDVGGHNQVISEDAYARWFQFGSLSTLMRVHCSSAVTAGRMPWSYGPTAEEVAHTYQDMRYRLLPLLYSLANENYTTGLPIMRRLDIVYPQYVEASANDEYLLGDYILVAPLSTWTGNDTRTVFFPEGTWIDVWTGERYSGPASVQVTHAIETSPIFVREGAIVALARNMSNVDEKDWSEMGLDLYPSANYSAQYTLYEDDAETVAYKSGQYRTTDISMRGEGNVLTVTIGAAQGTFEGDRAFARRRWYVRLHTNPGWGDIVSIRVNGRAVGVSRIGQTEYSLGGRPFAFEGAALDGDLSYFRIDTDVDTEYVIEITYASVQDSENNLANYDATGVSFDVSSQVTRDTMVALTVFGTTDWVSYGYSSATDFDRKLEGPALFGAPEESHMILSATYRSQLTATGIQKVYTDGTRQQNNTASGGLENGVGFRFTVSTTGNRQTIVLYFGASNCLSQLTVRDRAGNVRTILLGTLDNGHQNYKVTVECDAGTASELYFNYKVLAGKTQAKATTARVQLYCGYTFEE